MPSGQRSSGQHRLEAAFDSELIKVIYKIQMRRGRPLTREVQMRWLEDLSTAAIKTYVRAEKMLSRMRVENSMREQGRG